jgi:NADPH2:quinone reductase
MKTVRIHETGGTEVLKYEELADPEYNSHEVLVSIESISVNFSDTLIRRGLYPYMPDFPAILGNEAAGIITALGEDVKGLNIGQKVIVFGYPSYASLTAVPATRVIPIPESIDLDEAAALPIIYQTAYHMLHTVKRIKAGESVLIYAAAGGVGTAVLQLGKIAGIKMIGLTSTDEKAREITAQGIDYVINYKKENVVEKVLELTNGKGVDLILDCVGGPDFGENFKMMNTMGHLIWFGIAAGNPSTNLLAALGKEPAKSYAVSMFHLYAIINNPRLMAESFATLIGYLSEGNIKPVIHDRIPLAEAAKAHDILEKHENIGKVLLKP